METTHQILEFALNNQGSKNSSYQDKTRNDALLEVRYYMQNYWVLKDETPEYFLLTRTNDRLYGHLWIALALGWWSLFIPNLAYHLLMQKQKKIFK